VSAFALHAIFLLFLVAYYFLSGRPPIVDFLRIRTNHPFRLLAAGFPIAAFAWGISIGGMVVVQWVASLLAPTALKPQISPVIPWIVALPVGFKVAIVLSAMIFEEAFFRSFLQPRIGAVGATIFFTIAHGVYGNPAMLVGSPSRLGPRVDAELYGNALPGVVATVSMPSSFRPDSLALRFVG
jgi:membrane protease YdiL (CAAX protease family)